MRTVISKLQIVACMAAIAVPAGAQSSATPTADAPKGVVTGRVTLGDTTTPLAGAVVDIPQWGLADTTGADGRYRLNGVRAGAWILRVDAPDTGAGDVYRTVRPGSDAGVTLDIVLPSENARTCADVSRLTRYAESAMTTVAPTTTAPAASADGALRAWWTPESPVRGTALSVNVRTASGSDLTGTLAGEALHFAEVEPGLYRAVGAVPIDSAGSVELRVRRVGGPDLPDGRQLAVGSGNYRMERLQVAPRFGTAPPAEVTRRSRAESALAYAVARGAHDTPRQWTDSFIMPRESRVTSGFGNGREFNGAVQSRHMGVDLAGATGAPIKAANRGIVALVSDFYYAGTAVYIDHGGGLSTGYFHMSRADVAIGDTVSRGQVIGRVGHSGRVTGPHLHWIARYGGVTVDARSLLDLEPMPPVERCATEP